MALQVRRRNFILDSVWCAALFVTAIALYSVLFLHVPVLTEVRDFLVHQGWGARLSNLFIPTGDDNRPLSWSFFAWQHRVFPFDVEAINMVQFVLLGLGALVAYIHARQLLGNRLAANGASMLWLLSLPAIHAAFWQATQHDKLAFIFVLLTLIVSLYAIRLDRPKLTPVFTLLILLLVAISVATKPVAFMLPGALVAQVVLFTPEKSRSGYLRAAGLVFIPIAFAIAFVAGYLLKMNEVWLAHTSGGNITSNVLFYIRNITNLDYDGNLWFALLLFAPVALAWLSALWRWGNRFLGKVIPAKPQSDSHFDRDAVLVYLCAIFIGSIVVLARARFAPSFYLLLPMFAFTASLATVAITLFTSQSVRIRRSAGIIVSGVVIGLLSTCWISVTGSSNLGQWRQAATNLAHGYEVLRGGIDPEQLESVSFFFPREPSGYFYFFSDGTHQDIDPSIPSFIFRRTLTTPIENHFGEFAPHTASPGELIAVWSGDLQLVDARLGQTSVYHNAAAPAWPPVYVPGVELGFGQGDDGTQYQGTGWSLSQEGGTWSDGALAIILMTLDRPYQVPLDLVVSGQAFVTDGHPEQDVEVLANEQLIAHWTMHNENREFELRARIPAGIAGSDYIKLSFRMLNPRSPASLGLNTDERLLGIFLQKLQIRPQDSATDGDGHLPDPKE